MILENTFIVTEIKAKTKARLFKNVKVDEILRMSISLRNTSGARSGSYASTIKVSNGSEIEYFSQSELVNLINRCFELEVFSS